MADTIDLTAERTKRAQPDAEFITTDEYGRKFFKFIANYEFGSFDGKDASKGTFSINLWALDEAEAKARVEAIRQSLRYEGQLYSSRPA
jgi:hypothetical protein